MFKTLVGDMEIKWSNPEDLKTQLKAKLESVNKSSGKIQAQAKAYKKQISLLTKAIKDLESTSKSAPTNQ